MTMTGRGTMRELIARLEGELEDGREQLAGLTCPVRYAPLTEADVADIRDVSRRIAALEASLARWRRDLAW